MFAEDIAVAPNGSFAIVSDGGFSPYLAFINLRTFKLSKIQKTAIPNPNAPNDPTKDRILYAQAVAITPDSKTVLFADYGNRQIHSGRVNATMDGLTKFRSLFLCTNVDPADPKSCLGTSAWPVNVSIASDGQTAVVATASARRLRSGGTEVPVDGVVAALRINPLSGQVTKGKPFFVSGLPRRDAITPPLPAGPGGNQSVVIAPGGQTYVLTQPTGLVDDPDSDDPLDLVNRRNILARLKIVSPGKVVLNNSKYKSLWSRGTSQLFGVDNLALSSDGQWLVTSNPSTGVATNVLTVVNTGSGQKHEVRLPYEAIPLGVAIGR
jgi:hypothetical protein